MTAGIALTIASICELPKANPKKVIKNNTEHVIKPVPICTIVIALALPLAAYLSAIFAINGLTKEKITLSIA